MQKNTRSSSIVRCSSLLLVPLVLAAAVACREAEPAAECPQQAPRPVKMKTTVIQRPTGGNWCRACVRGAQWMSCQTAQALSPQETREQLLGRAFVQACSDAGFAKDACPRSALVTELCKGDPVPKTDPRQTEALRRAFLTKQRGVITVAAPASADGGVGGR